MLARPSASTTPSSPCFFSFLASLAFPPSPPFFSKKKASGLGPFFSPLAGLANLPFFSPLAGLANFPFFSPLAGLANLPPLPLGFLARSAFLAFLPGFLASFSGLGPFSPLGFLTSFLAFFPPLGFLTSFLAFFPPFFFLSPPH